MKAKARKRLIKKKEKKGSKILNVKNNYHEKKINNNPQNEIKKIDEKEIKEKLKIIYDLIKDNNYEKKPTELYINITESPLISKDDEDSLKKISTITQYKLISPIELIYKYNYEKLNKISNEKDKCSICQFIFYESE